MKKIILFFSVIGLAGTASAATTNFKRLMTVLNPNTGRPDYIVNTSSVSLGELFGVSTKTVTGAAASDGDVLTFKQWASSVTLYAKTPVGGSGGGGSLKSFIDSASGVSITSMNFLSDQFNRTTAGSSATFVLNPASITLQGNSISISTTASGLQNLFSRFTIFSSTVQMRIDQLETGISTAQIKIAHLYSWVPTTFSLVNTSTTNLFGLINSSAVLFSNFQNSVNSTMTAIVISTASLESKVLNGAVTIYDSGGFIGNATTLKFNTNLTATMSGSTATVNAMASGGGATSAGFIFTGSQNISFSTASFPGATITSNGVGGSTVTYMPAIFSTFTALTSTGVYLSQNWTSLFSTYTALVSTSISLSNFVDSSNSTMTALSNSTSTLFTNLTSTGVSLSRLWTVTKSTWDAFTNFTSTTQAFTESANSTMTAIRTSTSVFQTAYNQFTSTTQADFDTLRSSVVAIRTSTSTFENRFNLFSSTTQAFTESANSTMTAIRTSTSTFETRFNLFSSTVQAFSESTNSTMTAIRGSTSTTGTTLSQRTVVFSDEGSILTGGNVTRVDCVGSGVNCGQSGSTITVTVSGGSSVPPSVQSPSTGIYNLQSDAGTRYGIANSTGIEVGQNLQLTTWMSTATLSGQGQTKGAIVWDFDPVSLHALTTDYAVVDSTSSKLNFYLGALYDKATTNYRWGKRILPTNLDISSTVFFSAVVRSTNPTSGSNVQILFLSTATAVTGPSFIDLANSTGADIVSLSNVSGQMNMANWSQSVSNLGWKPDYELFFKLGRGHDTAKLLTTDYPGGLYILSFRMIIPVILPNTGTVDNLGNGVASTLVNLGGSFGITGATSAVFGVATATNSFSLAVSTTATMYHFGVSTSAYITSMGPEISLTSCGSGPTYSKGSNNFGGTVTAGATSNGCTVTFGIPFRNDPSCTVTPQAISLVNAFSYTHSNVGIVVTQTALGTGKFDYSCIGKE